MAEGGTGMSVEDAILAALLLALEVDGKKGVVV